MHFSKHAFFENAFFENAFFENFANFWRARSRLYQNEILQENMRSTAFFKLYKICILLHRCNLKIFAKNRFEKTAIFVKFQQKKLQMSQNLQNFVKFQKFQLENLVDFEKCCKTHIFLQKSEPIQPKTSNILPKFCQPTLSDVTPIFLSAPRMPRPARLFLWAPVGDTTADRQNFGKMLLVFGCIGTDFCKKIRVLQHFSKSTRLSSCNF